MGVITEPMRVSARPYNRVLPRVALQAGLVLSMSFVGCKFVAAPQSSQNGPSGQGTGAAPPALANLNLSALEAELVQRHGEAQRPRIARGLKQVAALWRLETGQTGASGDGDLAAFAREHFIADDAMLVATLARLEKAFE